MTVRIIAGKPLTRPNTSLLCCICLCVSTKEKIKLSFFFCWTSIFFSQWLRYDGRKEYISLTRLFCWNAVYILQQTWLYPSGPQCMFSPAEKEGCSVELHLKEQLRQSQHVPQPLGYQHWPCVGCLLWALPLLGHKEPPGMRKVRYSKAVLLQNPPKLAAPEIRSITIDGMCWSTMDSHPNLL